MDAVLRTFKEDIAGIYIQINVLLRLQVIAKRHIAFSQYLENDVLAGSYRAVCRDISDVRREQHVLTGIKYSIAFRRDVTRTGNVRHDVAAAFAFRYSRHRAVEGNGAVAGNFGLHVAVTSRRRAFKDDIAVRSCRQDFFARSDVAVDSNVARIVSRNACRRQFRI